MIKLIKLLFDILTPRFITERVVLSINDDGEHYVVCLEKDYEDFKYSTGFSACEFRGTSRAFNIIGFGCFAKVTID